MYEGTLLTTPSNGGDGFHDHMLVAQRHIESQAPPSQGALAVIQVNLSESPPLPRLTAFLSNSGTEFYVGIDR
jgi:hypothetical protein